MSDLLDFSAVPVARRARRCAFIEPLGEALARIRELMTGPAERAPYAQVLVRQGDLRALLSALFPRPSAPVDEDEVRSLLGEAIGMQADDIDENGEELVRIVEAAVKAIRPYLSKPVLNVEDFTRPISGIAHRSPHEVFDIMVSRIPQALRGAS